MFQAGKLRKDRQLSLEKIGLKWSMLATTSWESMFETLTQYVAEKKKGGNEWDGNVPANYRTEDVPPRALGRWINRQRSAYGKGKLKPEYVAKLNEIGLKWSIHERRPTYHQYARPDAATSSARKSNPPATAQRTHATSKPVPDVVSSAAKPAVVAINIKSSNATSALKKPASAPTQGVKTAVSNTNTAAAATIQPVNAAIPPATEVVLTPPVKVVPVPVPAQAQALPVPTVTAATPSVKAPAPAVSTATAAAATTPQIKATVPAVPTATATVTTPPVKTAPPTAAAATPTHAVKTKEPNASPAATTHQVKETVPSTTAAVTTTLGKETVPPPTAAIEIEQVEVELKPIPVAASTVSK